MPSITMKAALVAFAASALAAPVEQRSQGSFSVDRTRKPNHVRNGPAEYERVLRKYGIENRLKHHHHHHHAGGATGSTGSTGSGSHSGSTPPAHSSNSTGSGGSVGAKPVEQGSEYTCAVNIGGQTLNLDFDTGSSDLWVFSTSTPSNEVNGQTLFNPAKSSSFKNLQGYSWKISYGDGSSSSGTVGTDTVDIGGATVNGQAVELATTVSSEFTQDSASDGLLGLAFPSINTVTPNKQKTFLANIASSLAAPVLSAYLRTDGTGSYTFGSIDNSKFTGSLAYTPVDNSQGFWQFTSTSYAIGGKKADNDNASPAIADTGTTLLLVDEAVVSAYYAQVQGAQQTSQGYTFPSSANVPTFGVAIGDTGYYATVPSEKICFQNQGGTCFGAIQSSQGEPVQIYGDAVLDTQYVVFDYGNTRLGWAAQK